MKVKLKHIVVSQTNYNKLKHMGTAGMSFNDVITEVLRDL